MPKQGTWADNLIIQGVVDAVSLNIIIVIESDSKSCQVQENLV